MILQIEREGKGQKKKKNPTERWHPNPQNPHRDYNFHKVKQERDEICPEEHTIYQEATHSSIQINKKPTSRLQAGYAS